MDINLIIFYTGFVLAIALCWGLGRIFYIPMIADLLLDAALNLGLLSGYDIRLIVVTVGFAIFVWVLVLAGTLTRSAFLAVLLLDLTLVFVEIVPDLRAVGAGQEFWNATSTGILEVWMLSTFVVIASMAVRSTIGAQIQGRFVDVLTNPRKRFLLPLGAWSGIWVVTAHFGRYLPSWFVDHSYMIAAFVMVWGWVALELPFFLMYRRIKRQYR